jgi:acyl-CoA hydrolase
MPSISAAEAAALLAPRDRLAIPLGPGQPKAFLHALGERDDLVDVQVFGGLLSDMFRVFTQPGVELLSGFFGPVERGLRAAGYRVSFVPADFRRFTRIASELAPRVVATAGAPPDADGRISLSLHAGATFAEIQAVIRDPKRLLVVETSPHLPRTLGLPPEHPHSVHVDQVDAWIESEMQPPTLDEAPPSDAERTIAEHVREFVPESATLQTGIGAIPNQVALSLAEGDGGPYGIHSEMFTNGLMALHLAGKVNNHKGLYDGVSVTTFALGSRELYDWLDGQEAVRFLPVQWINDPTHIAHNRNMITLNGALSIDLAGQIVADTIGGTQYSGIGGHEDFVAGGGLEADDRSLICLPSTVEAGGETRSRILPALPTGSIVTTPRHQVDVVITEFGAAELGGRSSEARALALAEIAHPNFRDELRDAARSVAASGRLPAS